MQNLKSKAILAAACVGLATVGAQAAPLVSYQILGHVVGSPAGYTSSVTVSTGSAVEYKLVATFAPIGTVNTGTPVRTLTAVTATDGFNNMPKIDLFQSAGAVIDAVFSATGTAQAFGATTWSSGTGNSAGTPNAGDLIGVKNVAASGQFDTAGNSIYLGTFAIGTITGTSSLVGMRLSGVASAGSSGFRVHVNNGSTASNGTNILPVDSTESGANPYIALNGLTLVQAISNIAPSFTVDSGLQPGDTGIDAILDTIVPVNLATHSVTFSIPDSFIADESAATASVALGTLPAPLVGHVTIQGGRNIVVSGIYTDSPAIDGIYAIPLILSDTGSPAQQGAGTFTVQVVPEPASLGMLGLGGLALLRRRKTK